MRMTASALAKTLANTRVEQDYIPMVGGMDITTPPFQRKPGTCRDAQNFEADINGGYRRIPGYERFDGQASPSAANYWIISATITGNPALGNTLTGATSSATGVIIALPGGSFVLTKVSGTFQNGEELQISAATVATATSTATQNGASTSALHATYLNLAADKYRDDIAAVPGSGKILGGFYFNNVCYAFRNNAGGTAAALYKSSSSGWTAVALGRKLAFTTGSAAVTVGQTLTGATSGATGTVTGVAVRTGTWAGGNAVGIFTFASITGTFQNGENLQVSAATKAVASGADAAITLLPDGRFEIIQTNFGGGSTTKKVYGCDGVNTAWEFDGTTFIPIASGMTSDAPTHICAHKKHLFLSFLGGSVQHSSLADPSLGAGSPYGFSPVTGGASEIGVGEDVTAFASQPGSADGGALAIFTRNRTHFLFGSSSSDWNLVTFREELGAYAYTVQDVGFTMFLDDRGITDLQTSQAYGNFAHAVISNPVRDKVNEWRTTAIASCISRDRSQYRLFFTNNYVLYVTVVGRKVVGIMPILLADVPRCAWSSETNTGAEVIFFGSDAGLVFQMEKGTSFDGDAIEFFINLAYNFQKGPRVEKQYLDAALEINGSGYAQFSFGYSLGYGDTTVPQPTNTTVTTDFRETKWDSFTWDAFTWDGKTLLPSLLDCPGYAENISLAITGNADYYAPFTVTGALLNYTPLRRLHP